MKRKLKKIVFWIGLIASICGIIGFIFYLRDKSTSPRHEGTLQTYYGDTKVIFGSNAFIGTPNILVVNGKPVFTATVKNNKLYVSIIIFDKHGDVVAQIENNNWIINKNNYFRIESSKTELKVINQQNEIALHCTALPDGSVKVNGTFYIGGRKIVATDNGLTL